MSGIDETVTPAIDQPHTLTVDVVAGLLSLSVQRGMSVTSVALLQARYGLNQLPDAPARTAWCVFMAQFQSLLILILIGAAGLSALIGNFKDAAVILAVVIINATVGFYQEYRAEQSLAALKNMLPQRSRVRRDSEKIEIPAAELVPVDVVLLEAGDFVPADGRLLLAVGLEVDESTLTDESQAAAKQSANLLPQDTPLAERSNLVYMNTLVTRGRAEVIVTHTGTDTEMGRLSLTLAATQDAPTSLQIQLDQLGKRLGAIALILVGLLAVLEFMRGVSLMNRPGFRGGYLVKVKPGFRSSRQVAESSLPLPRPVEYTRSAPAGGGG